MWKSTHSQHFIKSIKSLSCISISLPLAANSCINRDYFKSVAHTFYNNHSHHSTVMVSLSLTDLLIHWWKKTATLAKLKPNNRRKNLNLMHFNAVLLWLFVYNAKSSKLIFLHDCRCCNKIYDTIPLHRKCTL